MSEINNYIPISRKLFESWLWLEKREFSYAEAWVDILRRGRFEANSTNVLIKGKMVEIHRGEIPASLRLMAEWWGWSKNRVDKFLNILEKERMIKKRTAIGTNQTVITICNYDKYNFISEISGQRWDKVGTEMGQSRDNINKDNKENKFKKENKKEIDLNFPFNSEKFMLAWKQLIEMPKWKKKVNQSLQIALNSLGKYDEEFAVELIEKAIEGNWQGVTFSNTPDDYEKWKRRKGINVNINAINANINPISANTNFKNANNLTNDERWGSK